MEKKLGYIRCGPCHRAAGRPGLPTIATPSRPDIDARGGFHGLCDGYEYEKPHGMVHVDHLGEPFAPENFAKIVAERPQWDEPAPGHTLMRSVK